MNRIKVALLDNDKGWLSIVSSCITEAGIPHTATHDTNEFMASITDEPTVPILDFYLDYGITGVDVMRKVLEKHKLCSFIFISTDASVDQLLSIIDMNWGCLYVRKDDTKFIENLIKAIERSRSSLKEKVIKSYESRLVWEEFKSDAIEMLNLIDNGQKPS